MPAFTANLKRERYGSNQESNFSIGENLYMWLRITTDFYLNWVAVYNGTKYYLLPPHSVYQNLWNALSILGGNTKYWKTEKNLIRCKVINL